MTEEIFAEVVPELSIEPRDGYLVARIAGSVSMQRMKDLLGEVIGSATTSGARRVLLDVHRVPVPAVRERFDLAHWVAHRWPVGTKLAVVTPIPEEERDYLTESVMLHHGHCIYAFGTEEEAAHWLLRENT